MSTFRTALEALRACERGLAENPTAEHRAELLRLMHDTLQLLEASSRQRLASAALAERVQRLESSLADRSPGERRAIICERLGISRSRFYEVRKTPDCNAVY